MSTCDIRYPSSNRHQGDDLYITEAATDPLSIVYRLASRDASDNGILFLPSCVGCMLLSCFRISLLASV